MINGFITIKEPVINQNYGFVLPENTNLYYFEDEQNRIFALHPDIDKLYTRIAKTNIKKYYPLTEKLIKMLQCWIEEKRAFSHVGSDDKVFFDTIHKKPQEVGVTSQTGSDLLYYDTDFYLNDDNAIKKLKTPCTP